MNAAITTNPKAFQEVIESRRSVRIFDGSPVPPDVVNQCLDLALLAPNSSNMQPWEFHWVRSPEKKAALVTACLSQPAARTAAELIVAVGRTNTWRRSRNAMLELFAKQGDKIPPAAVHYYKKILPIGYIQGPWNLFGLTKKLLFFLRGLRKPTPREPTSREQMRQWAIKSCSLACENLMLAFRAHGFDTCAMEGLDSRRVAKLLDLPRDAVVVMAIAIGKRAPNGVYGPRIRFTRDWFVKEV